MPLTQEEWDEVQNQAQEHFTDWMREVYDAAKDTGCTLYWVHDEMQVDGPKDAVEEFFKRITPAKPAKRGRG